MTMLTINNISKRFGGIIAINDLSFSVGAGEVLGVIGPNGSGKTTLINIISGVYKPNSGRIVFEGRDIQNLKTWERTRLGIVRSFQIPSIFKEFTVSENLAYSLCFSKGYSKTKALELVKKAIEEHELSANKKGSELTLFEERLVEILRVLLLEPKLVLIDEIFSGLTAQEADKLGELIIKNSSNSKFSMIWVEHRVKELIKYVNRLIVLNFGYKIAEGKPDEVIRRGEVIEAYLGGVVLS
jgi:branched-chain amino acid transport system ATP-binding protein